jgi:hypothetical protein
LRGGSHGVRERYGNVDSRPMNIASTTPVPARARVHRACCSVALTVALMGGASSGVAAPRQAVDTGGCGDPYAVQNGPFDYRSERGDRLKVVEDHHFTPRVEALIAGTSSSVGGDLAFTLRAFPNHHRALVSMMNLGAKLKTPLPPGAQWSVECYFRRAVVFQPEDLIARMLYAKFLAGAKRKAQSMEQLAYVVHKADDSSMTHYNAGLLYFDLGEFDKALAQAHRAQALGFEQAGLKQKLAAAGKWVEPAPTPASAASR